ncbi:hypothetical protein GH714_028855 [Hevea brasiliensis]|uniref:Uncharacterized protein n=1 Tax=Hevea brasiliensis TaxID=3981 RepID=A0A6A6N8S6_HEVBR|nr:hypothetical protein GH714_028855 [Hevea brasiliensis]
MILLSLGLKLLMLKDNAVVSELLYKKILIVKKQRSNEFEWVVLKLQVAISLAGYEPGLHSSLDFVVEHEHASGTVSKLIALANMRHIRDNEEDQIKSTTG